MGNTKGRLEDQKDTINSSQSFAQRLTESQLVNNDHDESQRALRSKGLDYKGINTE